MRYFDSLIDSDDEPVTLRPSKNIVLHFPLVGPINTPRYRYQVSLADRKTADKTVKLNLAQPGSTSVVADELLNE
jgi:hypothetical protein